MNQLTISVQQVLEFIGQSSLYHVFKLDPKGRRQIQAEVIVFICATLDLMNGKTPYAGLFASFRQAYAIASHQFTDE